MKILDQLSSLAVWKIRAIGTALVILVGLLDYSTGDEISYSLFYLIPLVLVSWYDGKRWGIALSVVSAAFWFSAEFDAGDHLVIHVWNAINRLGIFVGVTLVLNMLRETYRVRMRAEIEKYERIIETAVEGVIIFGKDASVRYANARAATLLGYQSTELLGKPCTELIPDSESRGLVNVQRTVAGAVEIQFTQKDGSLVWTIVSASSVLDAQNRYDGVLLSIIDISQKKNAEQELQRRYSQISGMQQLSSVLARSIHFDRRLEAALKTVLDLTQFDGGAVYLLNGSSKELELLHHEGLRPDSLGSIQRWRIGYGITGRVCVTGVAQFLEDAEHDPVIDPHVRTGEGIRSFAAIPLVSEDTVLGVLSMFRRQPYAFSADEKIMLQTFGKQIGVALENARLFEAARARERQVRQLSIDLVRIQEEERKRFARELHDGLAQVLMTLRVNAELALRELGLPGDKAEKHLTEVITLVGEAETEAKQISYDLRPAILDDFGLKAAIEVLVRNFERRTSIGVDLHLPDVDYRFDSVIETSVYRIVQELLSNAGRHSGASHLTIQLLVRAHLIALTVADDGKGFNYKESIVRNAVNFHSGLRNMRERTESLGGTFRVESTPGHGAEFMIEVPRALARVETTGNEQASQ